MIEIEIALIFDFGGRADRGYRNARPARGGAHQPLGVLLRRHEYTKTDRIST